jgi:hypothetical protein
MGGEQAEPYLLQFVRCLCFKLLAGHLDYCKSIEKAVDVL